MDGMKFQKLYCVERTLQLIVSVSMLSFFLCYSCDFCSSPEIFNVYFSTSILNSLKDSLERKYMFLICNVIIAFLVRHSVSRSFQEEETSVGYLENVAILAVAEPEQEDQENVSTDKENVKKVEDSGVLVKQEEDELHEKTDEDLVSTDELNKKVEEFIKKMKQKIRTEAEQQLIAV